MKNLKSMLLKLSFVFVVGLFSTITVNAEISVDSDEGRYLVENTDPADYYIDENGNFKYTNNYLNSQPSNDYYQKTRNAVCWGARNLSITNYTQSNSYYCGPANVKQVLQYINGSSLSQSTYASNMGTNSSGTYVYRIRNELNNKQSYHTYAYTQMGSGDLEKFKNIISSDIFYGNDTEVKGIPVILHALTKALPIYNSHNTGHYLTVSGYSAIARTVTYVDTNSSNYGNGNVLGSHTVSAEIMFQTVSGSRYVIH